MWGFLVENETVFPNICHVFFFKIAVSLGSIVDHSRLKMHVKRPVIFTPRVWRGLSAFMLSYSNELIKKG